MSNISTAKETCLRECRKTWRGEHGGALSGGPFPGTQAKAGDVRRCEHGRIWEYSVDYVPNHLTFDYWYHLDWFRYPIQRHRAKVALARGVG